MSNVIEVRGLSKSYILHHEGRERYLALRDVITQKTRNLLSISGSSIEKSTKEEFWALKDINFNVEVGDRVGIIGRNGAGKSTLLKILSRITEPTNGSVKIKGRIASLLEVGTGFHPELTGRENIFLNGAILGMSRSEVKKHFDAIVDFAEIEKFLDTPVKRYSSGMYVRLAFAVAAHLEPEILIIDEVLAVGDAQFQKKCLGKMENVSKNEGRTVLFVSHNMGVVSQLCNRGIVLGKGSVNFDGLVEEALDTYLRNSMSAQNYYSADNQDKEFYFERVELFNENSESTSYFGASDVVGLKVNVKKKKINPHVKFSCTIQNRNGEYLSTFVKDMEEYFVQDEGDLNFIIKYPPGILAPNSYAMRLALFLPRGHVFDLIEMVCPFTIIDDGTSMAIFEGHHYGYFHANESFSVL